MEPEEDNQKESGREKEVKETQGRRTEDRTGGSLCRAGRNSVVRPPN